MKKWLVVFSLLLMASLLNAQDIIDIGGMKNYSIDKLEKNESFDFKQIGTTEGFELDLIAKTSTGHERYLAKIKHFSGYKQLCNDGKFYFSIDNHFHKKTNPDLFSELFVLDIKNGVITKILDSLAFTVSSDGKYICYCEVYQNMKKENHEVLYWYLYDTKKNKSKVIINQKQKNNWDVFIPKYDDKNKKFVFGIGYETTVMDTIVIDPNAIKF